MILELINRVNSHYWGEKMAQSETDMELLQNSLSLNFKMDLPISGSVFKFI